MRIYVAGPYTAATPEAVLRHVVAAMEATVTLIRRGHTPFCPHLSHFLNVVAGCRGGEVPYETWMEQDFAWLDQCEALLLLAPSPGALREHARAQLRGLPCYYSLEEVPWSP